MSNAGEPVPGGRDGTRSSELVLLQADNVYRWRGRTMGRTILRTHRGLLLLTTHRLVFLSSGRSGAWWRMAWASLGLGPDPVVTAATVAEVTKTVAGWVAGRFGGVAEGEAVDIPPAQLHKDGSLSVALTDLTEYGVTIRRWSNFLWIAYRAPGETAPREFTFSNQVAIPGGTVWALTIERARRALLAR